ncbi:MAG TPA: hypothetical protein VFC14_18420 [Burkholderiales bacterium]|nr:hypothetical protein [Burkholderiales bacterium]
MYTPATGSEEQSELRGQYIIETIQRLERRISQRFPGSGLSRVSARLGELAGQTEAQIEHVRKPLWLARAVGVLGLIGLALLTEEIFRFGMPGSWEIDSLSDFLQATEAGANLVVLLTIGTVFMVSLERRFKRRAALVSLYRLRSIIHIVDMHQLTKDPEFVTARGAATTPASPARTFTRFELSRYLDYCSEMFSLTSKVAALYAQHLHDAVVLGAVNEIESLAASLSHKIWQKIMILNSMHPGDEDDPVTMEPNN